MSLAGSLVITAPPATPTPLVYAILVHGALGNVAQGGLAPGRAPSLRFETPRSHTGVNYIHETHCTQTHKMDYSLPDTPLNPNP